MSDQVRVERTCDLCGIVAAVECDDVVVGALIQLLDEFFSRARAIFLVLSV